MPFIQFLKKRKYEILLFGLCQHLFMGMVLVDLSIYTRYFWPVNMVILGLASFEVFLEKVPYRLFILRSLVFIICSIPVLSWFTGMDVTVMVFLSLTYALFFSFVFHEVIKFLIRPGYINTDIISAAGCGYLLLIEVATFTQQFIFYLNPTAYKGLDLSHPAATYIDFVYFSTICITSIGLGDILPTVHYAKLLTSLIGIIGQFYTVVLMGILISKFVNNQGKK